MIHTPLKLYTNLLDTMKNILLGGLLFATLIITSAAEAQTRTPEINARQHSQERRINQGVRNGELTHREARSLRNDERRLNAEKHVYKSNGYVNRRERRHMRRQEKRINHAIYQKKHNGRVRY